MRRYGQTTQRRAPGSAPARKFTASCVRDTRAPWDLPEHRAGAVKKNFPAPFGVLRRSGSGSGRAVTSHSSGTGHPAVRSPDTMRHWSQSVPPCPLLG